MKKLLKTMLVFIMVAVIASCSDEEATVAPVKEDNIKTDTKISIEQARQDLLGLLSDLDSERSRSYGKLPRTIKEAHSFKLGGNESRSEESPNYYVFNFDNNQGYAIMSGDERMPSLIALTDSGSFNENDSIDNPGLEIFFSNLKVVDDSIKIMPNPGAIGCIDWDDTEYRIYGSWETNIYKDYGYCPVKWGNIYPYNKYCPVINGELKKPNCASIALAQLMAAHQFPSSYGDFNFSWKEMVKYPVIDFCSTKGQDDIARLISLIGLPENLNVDYIGASSKESRIITTLKNFGYIVTSYITDYNETTISYEIGKGYPVIMSGQSIKNSNEAHIWLIHGLLVRTREVKFYDLSTKKYLRTETECEYYPLCNWGWSGKDNGYYLSRVFNTNVGPVYYTDGEKKTISRASDEEYNYQYRLKILAGIRK